MWSFLWLNELIYLKWCLNLHWPLKSQLLFMTIMDFILLRKIYDLCQYPYNYLPKGALEWWLIVLYSNRSVLRIMRYQIWENILICFGNFFLQRWHTTCWDCYCSWKNKLELKVLSESIGKKGKLFLSQICFNLGTSIHWIFNFIKSFASGSLESSIELEDGISITSNSRP